MTPEEEAEAVLGNIVTSIASALRPSAVLAVPLLSATLLPCPLSLPASLLQPSPLPLPGDRLLLCAAWLRLLPGLLRTRWQLPLLLPLLRLLGLRLLLPLPPLRLLDLRLLLPVLRLLVLGLLLLLLLLLLPLLCGRLRELSAPVLRPVLMSRSVCLRWLRLSLRALLLWRRRCAFLLLTLSVLLVLGNSRSEKQKQGRRTCSSS